MLLRYLLSSWASIRADVRVRRRSSTIVDISADAVAILIIGSIVRASVASIAHAVFVTVELIGVRVLRAIIIFVADVVIVGVLELIDATREQFASVDGTRVVIVAIGLSPAGTLAIHAGVVGGAVVTVLAYNRIGLVHAAGRGVT